MRYAILNGDNTVNHFVEVTQTEYDALSAVQKADLYVADELVTDEYIYEDRWYSPEEIRDREFTEDPQSYKNYRLEMVNLYRGGIFAAGFEFDGQRFKGEANDQLWMTAFLKLLDDGTTSPPVNWIAIDNSIKVFDTITEFQQMTTTFFGWAQQTVFTLLALKQQIRDAETREAVDALYEPFVADMKNRGILVKESGI